MVVRLIFIACAVIFIAVGLIMNSVNSDEGKIFTDAKISSIDSHIDARGNIKYDVYVEFEYKGKEYKNIVLPTYEDSMYEGMSVGIRFNPDEPEKIAYTYGDGNSSNPIGIILAGVAVILGVGVSIVFSRNKSNKAKKLKKEGRLEYGIITEVKQDLSIAINRRHPYKVKCEYIDTQTGQTIICEGGRIWEDAQCYVGRQVKIYVDKKERWKYYIDVEELINSKSTI